MGTPERQNYCSKCYKEHQANGNAASNETAAAVLNAATQTATQTPTTTIATTTISTTTATTATTPNTNKRDSSGDVDAENNGDEQPPARKVQRTKSVALLVARRSVCW